MSTKRRYIETVWEVWTYDVWGNARDGWDVNNRFCVTRALRLRLPVQTFNVDTPREFDSASPTDGQLRRALDINRGVKITKDGDDLAIIVSLARNDYPVGELLCTSHESLSPIRARDLTDTEPAR